MFRTFRDSPHEFIITMGSGCESPDLSLFFGLSKDYKFGTNLILDSSRTVYLHYPEVVKFDQILVDLQIFDSKSDAKRNNWVQEIIEGYSEIHKKFTHFYILKLTTP